MKKVFLTGANGFLGNNLARELILRGYTVHGLIQRGTDGSILNDTDVIRFDGDLLDPTSLIPGLEGCKFIIHTAGSTSINPARDPMVRKVNIEGTRNMLDLAVKFGVERLVHVGTANTFGFGTVDDPGDETKPYGSAGYQMDYMDSKLEAHHLVLEYCGKYGLPVIIVNPTFMIGPNDPGPSSNEMVRQIADGGLPGYSSGGRNFAYVKDNCVAIANALTMGRLGESYILGNANMTYKEAFILMARIIGANPPKIGVPDFVFIMLGSIMSGFARIIPGFKPKITLQVAQIGCDEQFFSSRKAINELQLPQTPIEQAIRESFIWLRDSGKLKKHKN